MPDNQSQRPGDAAELKTAAIAGTEGHSHFFADGRPGGFNRRADFAIGGAISFFSSFGSFEPPHYFWLCFVGIPLMFVGFLLSQFGYMGVVARYIAGEAAPVATDTTNYMAEETKGAVETVARSAARGIVEGIEAGKATSASFCPQCGFSVKPDFKFCPQCGKSLSKS